MAQLRREQTGSSATARPGGTAADRLMNSVCRGTEQRACGASRSAAWRMPSAGADAGCGGPALSPHRWVMGLPARGRQPHSRYPLAVTQRVPSPTRTGCVNCGSPGCPRRRPRRLPDPRLRAHTPTVPFRRRTVRDPRLVRGRLPALIQRRVGQRHHVVVGAPQMERQRGVVPVRVRLEAGQLAGHVVLKNVTPGASPPRSATGPRRMRAAGQWRPEHCGR